MKFLVFLSQVPDRNCEIGKLLNVIRNPLHRVTQTIILHFMFTLLNYLKT